MDGAGGLTGRQCGSSKWDRKPGREPTAMSTVK